MPEETKHEEDKLEHARKSALGSLESIVNMMKRLEHINECLLGDGNDD